MLHCLVEYTQKMKIAVHQCNNLLETQHFETQHGYKIYKYQSKLEVPTLFVLSKSNLCLSSMAFVEYL